MQGSVRLTEGLLPREGIVQVCLEDFWGTVCREGWDETDAQVLCEQLNFTTPGL